MKAILLLVISLSVVAVRAAEKEVKLLGVASGLGRDFALVDTGGASPEWLRVVSLRTGQSKGDVEMGTIDAAKGTATVKVNGKEQQLSMPSDWDYGSTNELNPALPVMYFRALSLQQAVALYGEYKKRTMLVHPRLSNATFSIKMNPHTEAEAAEAWEKLFHERNVATVPDGEHLVMVVPFAFTNKVAPSSDTLPKSNSLIPAMSVEFHNNPMGAVVQTYADCLHKDIANRAAAMRLAGYDSVTFVQITPISRDELSYALKTYLAWSNLQFVPNGSELELQRIH